MKVLIILSLVLAATIATPILEIGTKAETDVTANIKGDNTDLKDHILKLVGGGETNANIGFSVDVVMDVKNPIPEKTETVTTNIKGYNSDVVVGEEQTNANIGVPVDLAMDLKDYIPEKAEIVTTNLNGYNTDLKDHIPILTEGGETNANIGASVEVAKDVKGPTPVSVDTVKDVKDPTPETDGSPVDEELFMLLAAFADPTTEVKPEATR